MGNAIKLDYEGCLTLVNAARPPIQGWEDMQQDKFDASSHRPAAQGELHPLAEGSRTYLQAKAIWAAHIA